MVQRSVRRGFKQFPNMRKANIQAQIQDEFDNKSPVEEVEVYKPTYTLEMNRLGELVVFSAEPLRHKTLYFKYPYTLFDSAAMLAFWQYVVNPRAIPSGVNLVFFFMSYALCTPHAWYFHSMQYRIRRMSLLRGGKYVKFERMTMGSDFLTNWGEISEFKLITKDFRNFDDKENAEFLNEEGQLKYELAVQLENFVQGGLNNSDACIFFIKEGTVHHPEVFDAIVRGYHIDTSDFVINTSHQERTREPHYNV